MIGKRPTIEIMFLNTSAGEKMKMKGPGHKIGIIGEGGKNAKQYSIPYGWSMCNRELFCIPVAVMIHGDGR